jgi:hypothetical protein
MSSRSPLPVLRICLCLQRCAFLILKNFKKGRWLGSDFFSAKKRPVVRIPQQDSAERAFNKLARTFAAQVETLKRYRGSGEQTMPSGKRLDGRALFFD